MQAAAPNFAPPLDRPIGSVLTETRVIGGQTRRFSTERRITFRREPRGLVALVETLSVDGDTPDRTGRMFEAATRGTIGRKVEVVLDFVGRATDVLDREAHWNAQVDAIGCAIGAAGAPLLAPLRAAPTAAQVQRLAGPVNALIDHELVTKGARPQHGITLPIRAHDGSTTTLSGTEQVTRDADGTLRLERRATGTLANGATM